jgi:phosphoribosylformylglycinamidine synthase PurS subunit
VRFAVQMIVELRPGLADPQGRAILDALPALGWDNVPWLTAGKYFHFHVEAPDEPAARRQSEEMAKRLLANPVIERYEIQDVAPANGEGASA